MLHVPRGPLFTRPTDSSTPPLHHSSALTTSRTSRGKIAPSHGNHRRYALLSRHRFPLLPSVLTPQVTCNGQDYTDSGTTFLYQADASVHNVSLSAGLDPGGFGLFISGEGFVNSTSLFCRVGGSNTPATFLSSTVVLCFVPRAATGSIRGSSAEQATVAEIGGEGSGEGVVRGFGPRAGDDGSSPDAWLGPPDGGGKTFFVEVSNNGLDFTADRVSYTVEQACPGGSFCVGPDPASILPCPQVTRSAVA